MILIFGGGDMAEGIADFLPDCKILEKTDVDVRDEKQIALAFVNYHPDVVINCAGVSYVQPIKRAVSIAWEDEIETNLIGSYHIAKFSVAIGVKKIIFIASVAGKYGKAEHSGYCASKAGVISLIQSLAMEGYNAYAISPGRVDTKMRERDYPGEDVLTRLTTKQIAQVVRDI